MPPLAAPHAAPDRPAAPAGSLRELFRIATPLIFSAGSLMLMHFVDRMFLTWYSTDALAASTQASMLNWSLSSLAIGTVSYVNTFVSQYHGAGQKARISQSIWQGIYVGIGFLPLTFGMAYAFWLALPYAGHAPEILRLEQDYFALLLIASVPSILATPLSSFYSGRGETMTILCVNIGMLATNTILDAVMIFGAGPFPAMGIRGAGIATICSTAFGLFLYVALMLRRREKQEYRFWKERRFDRELCGRLMRYGFPSGLQLFGDVFAFAIFLFVVGRLGRDAQAATNLAFNLNSLVFIPMLGLGTAVTVLVGRRIGEGRPQMAVRTTWLAFGVTAFYVIVFAFVYLGLPDVILEPYRRRANPEEFARLEPLVRQLLVFVAIYSLSDAMAVIFGAAVRAAGDTRFAFVITFLSAWLLMALPVIVAESLGKLTLTLCWIACSAHIIFLGGGFLWRFQQGRWKSMAVIEKHLIEETRLKLVTDELDEPSAELPRESA